MNMCDGGGCVPSLADRIRLEVEPCAREAVASASRMALTGWRLLPGDGLRREADGSVTLPLPDDFLMLFSLRMTGWEREVTDPLPASHWLARQQGSRHHGLRATPSRPVAVMTLTAGAGGEGVRALRIYGCEPGCVVDEGWYMPAPSVGSGGEIDVPPAAYGAMLRLIAARVSQGGLPEL